jgi:hypothetical protein
VMMAESAHWHRAAEVSDREHTDHVQGHLDVGLLHWRRRHSRSNASNIVIMKMAHGDQSILCRSRLRGRRRVGHVDRALPCTSGRTATGSTQPATQRTGGSIPPSWRPGLRTPPAPAHFTVGEYRPRC